MRKTILLYLFLMQAIPGLYAQAVETSVEAHLLGLVSTGDSLPFWMYSNQRGRIYPETDFSGRFTAKATIYADDETFFEAGGGILYRNGVSNELIDDELYLHFETHFIHVTVGRKQRPDLYKGLSASNESILWSLNARPLPGLQLGTNGPVFIYGDRGLGFDISWNEFLLDDDRHMQGARLHNKSLHFLYRTKNGFQIKAGFRHFGHWQGRQPDGNRPQFTTDYFEAVSLTNTQQHHLTSYELNISKDFYDYRLELLYNQIATDRSGRSLGNIPDGRYGIYYEHNDANQWINAAIYELYYTKHQDYQATNWPGDDYFNHNVYRSGWAYENKILGAPFFTYDPETGRVVNNKFIAHHIGIGGQYYTYFKTYPYRLLLSYSRNQGTHHNRLEEQRNQFSGYFDLRIFESPFNVNVQVATDLISTSSSRFGAGVSVSYRL